MNYEEGDTEPKNFNCDEFSVALEFFYYSNFIKSSFVAWVYAEMGKLTQFIRIFFQIWMIQNEEPKKRIL